MTIDGLSQLNQKEPLALIDAVINDVLADISVNKSAYQQDQKQLQKMVNTRIAPHFDFMRIAQLTMGKNWREANESQRMQIAEAFQALLVRTYANRLLDIPENPKDRVTVKSQHYPNPNRTIINMAVRRTHGDPVNLSLRMEKRNDAWQVIDVMIDGVSLVISYRTQFEYKIRSSGIDALITSLSEEW
mgnify:CR=1 FL=1